MKTEKPISTKRYKSAGHQLELRVMARQIHETYCAQKGCKFLGKAAAQGVCFSRLSGPDTGYLERVEKRAKEFLAETRALRRHQQLTDRQYIHNLEMHLFCDWMNSEFTLDELVRLRGEHAKLRLKKIGARPGRT